MEISVLMLVRALHIVLGALWLGTAVLLTVYLVPAMRSVGPAGAPVMGQLGRRQLGRYILVVASLTALTGLWLYWRVTNGLQPSVMLSTPVLVLGIGVACGLLALAVGLLVVTPTIKRVGMAMGAAGGLPEGEERNVLLQRLDGLHRRFALASRSLVVLLVIAVLCMTLTHLL